MNNEKEQKSIKRLKAFEPADEPYYLCYSGGKDSDCIRILVNSNFSEGDYFVTFTYKRENRPASMDEARKQWNKVLRRLRTAYKKQGAEFKYLWCLEHKKYAYHFHLLCNNEINSKCFVAAWDFGKVNTETLDNREYHTVGEYMKKEQYIKDEGNTTKTERCYGSSRNLVRPEADITVLESGDWNDVPDIEVEE